MARSNLGRYALGVAALASGLVMLVWPDYKDYDQLSSILNAVDGPIFVYLAAAAQIAGGVAVLFDRTAKIGAAVLTAGFLALTLVLVPQIVAAPLVYGPWGNFFEPFSVAAGASIVYARLSAAWPPETISRAGRIVFAICAVNFALYQALYPAGTIPLVPKWLPPSQLFWADATTLAFALAAVALLINRMALLATRLMTLMVVMFGILVWVPAIISNPHSQSNWSEIVLNFAIAGAVWVLADLLVVTAPNRAQVRWRPAP